VLTCSYVPFLCSCMSRSMSRLHVPYHIVCSFVACRFMFGSDMDCHCIRLYSTYVSGVQPYGFAPHSLVCQSSTLRLSQPYHDQPLSVSWTVSFIPCGNTCSSTFLLFNEDQSSLILQPELSLHPRPPCHSQTYRPPLRHWPKFSRIYTLPQYT
jgi:hypothetical protein